MFTGIIEELGEVKKIQSIGRNTLLEIKSDKVYEDNKLGSSVAVNGVCLTVVKKYNNIIAFQIMSQTRRNTNLGNLRTNEKVNLESSLKLGDRISGHFVYGHIDCIGIIRRKRIIQDNICFEIVIPNNFISKVFPRGSIAVDGISLTVQEKRGNTFFVYTIPYTLKNSTLGFRHPSDKVNIEIDKLGTSIHTGEGHPAG